VNYREFGRTGWHVSSVSFGTWAIGGTWGSVDDRESLAALHRAVDLGVNFFDTADVYGDGRSECLLAQLKRERSEEIIIATKAGRRLDPHIADGYTIENLTAFIERSLRNLEVEALDLLQLHCPPTEVYYRPELFAGLDDLVRQGKIRHYGVSVEQVEQALKAIEYPGVETVQIIFKRQVGILARLPLSSGMLAGKLTLQSEFGAGDHRAFNRHGEEFDRGETFSGIDYEKGLQAVEELRALVPAGMTMAQFALRWILMFDAVTCAIPGAKRPGQVEDNVGAADLPALTDVTMKAVEQIYQERIRELVHHYW
jgi:aryl-alcohol dehydrogenase-like predicted oxidoreductase